MACGILFPARGSSPVLLHWDQRVLSIGPPGKSLLLSFYLSFFHSVSPSLFLSLLALSLPLPRSLSLPFILSVPFSLHLFLSLPPSLSHCLSFFLSHLASQMLTPQLCLLQPAAFSMLLFRSAFDCPQFLYPIPPHSPAFPVLLTSLGEHIQPFGTR